MSLKQQKNFSKNYENFYEGYWDHKWMIHEKKLPRKVHEPIVALESGLEGHKWKKS